MINNPVIAWIWFSKLRKFSVCPVKPARINYNSSDGCAVSAYKLCCRQNSDIRPVINRFHNAHSYCVIHHKRDAVVMGNTCNLFKIRHIKFRVSDGFSKYGSCFTGYCLSEFFRLVSINKYHLPSELREGMVEKLICSSIKIISSNYLISRQGNI